VLPLGLSAINGRNAASTGVSPFFLAYRWEQALFDFELEPTTSRRRHSLVQ